MRSRRFLIAGAAMILSLGMLYAGKKHENENWMSKPFNKWNMKQVTEVWTNSAWAVKKDFRGNVSGEHGNYNPNTTGTQGATLGTDVPQYTFTARLFSAQPIREAYVRMIELKYNYDGMTADKQHALDQKTNVYLGEDVSQKIVVLLEYGSNDPNAIRDMNQWFNTQTTETLNQNAYLYSPIAGQLVLEKYFPPSQNGGLGAQFIFPRTFKGEPVLQPGSEKKMRFQLSWQPQINQTMYIDFDPKDMTYKDQLAY
ncbi:MAG: hypothetical protein WAO35_06485 [Terriglobia bacterium]